MKRGHYVDLNIQAQFYLNLSKIIIHIKLVPVESSSKY